MSAPVRRDGTAAYVPPNTRPHGGHELLLALAGRPRRALDVGCSTGYLASRLVERGSLVTGIERDAAAAEEARRWCQDVLVGDVEIMDFPLSPGSFDVVLCGDVLEHLREPGLFLERVRPLIAPGGRVVLSTPNVANWAMRLGLLAGRWRYTDRGILDRTHVHLFTRKTLVECLEGAGYRVDALKHTAPVPRVGTPGVEGLARAVAGIRPSLLAYQFVAAASPR